MRRASSSLLLLAFVVAATASCNSLLGISDPEDEGTDATVDDSGGADVARDSLVVDVADTARDTADGGGSDVDALDTLDAADTGVVTDSGVPETSPDVVVDTTTDTGCMPTTYQAAVAADLPLDWWELDETTGTVAHDRGSAPHDGSYGGALTLGRPGAMACSLGIAMHGGIFDVLGTPTFAPHKSFSAELWVQPENVDSTPRYVFGHANGTDGGWYLYSTNAGLVFIMFAVSSGATTTVTGAALTTTAPTHVVAGYDQVSDTMVLYENGALSSTATGTPGVPDLDVHLTAGNPVGLSITGTTGLYDEIAIYDKLLSLTQVVAHYAAH